MKTLIKIVPVFVMLLSITFAGCKKENIGNNTSYNNSIEEDGYISVKMTEGGTSNGLAAAGVPFITAVYIDISSIELQYANEKKEHPGWVKLNTNAGVYNLFSLQNNIMATIANDTQLPVGDISQIRLILGQENAVLIGSDGQHTLTVPNREIKIDLDTFIKEKKHLVITLGFDAYKSVVEEDNGTFTLKPQIAIKSLTTN